MIDQNLNGEYVSPLCEEFAILAEGTILTSSTPAMLDEFEDNSIFNEIFY